MGKLLIARHGETDWNSQGRIQGHSDIKLSEQGVQQARFLGERLRSVAVDAAYCSDLLRASETAEISLEGRDLPLHRTPLLREYHKGAFEGLTNQQIQERYPAQYPTYLTKDLDFAPEGGESTRAVSVRASGIITEIKNRHIDDTVLVVGHGGSLRAAMVSLLGLPLEANWRFFFANCALTIVETYPDNAVLRLFNDSSHLNGLGPAQ
jgi:broad specificity phosphatase PhoE